MAAALPGAVQRAAAPRGWPVASPIAAKQAIADALGMPLGRLAADQRAAIDAILREALERSAVLARARSVLAADNGEGGPC
jgi:hypothetical protein